PPPAPVSTSLYAFRCHCLRSLATHAICFVALFIHCPICRRYIVSACPIPGDTHTSPSEINTRHCTAFAPYRIFYSSKSTLSCTVDRCHPRHMARGAASGSWVPLERSCLL